MKLFALALLVGVAAATTLTSDNWDAETAGKTAFIKFQSPWCGHCKKLKPAWDKLMAEFADSKTVVIGDVDCTADGKSLCEANGVQGYPTIKSGDPASLEDYNGGRDFDELKKFASSLKPSCSPGNIDLCDEEGKKKIEDVMALSDDDLAAKITEGEDKVKAAGKDFDEALEKLQAQYQELVKTKDDSIAEVKSSGLGLLKAVQAHKKKAGAGKEEL